MKKYVAIKWEGVYDCRRCRKQKECRWRDTLLQTILAITELAFREASGICTYTIGRSALTYLTYIIGQNGGVCQACRRELTVDIMKLYGLDMVHNAVSRPFFVPRGGTFVCICGADYPIIGWQGEKGGGENG